MPKMPKRPWPRSRPPTDTPSPFRGTWPTRRLWSACSRRRSAPSAGSCTSLGRRSTIVGLPPSAVPNFAKSLIVVARRGFSDAARRSIVSRGFRNPARSQNARFSLAHRLAATCRERDVRDESASVCLGGAGRQCIEAVLPLATDEVRVDVRAPSRSAVFRYGQHVSAVERVFTRHNPLVFHVRETV